MTDAFSCMASNEVLRTANRKAIWLYQIERILGLRQSSGISDLHEVNRLQGYRQTRRQALTQ